VSGVREEEEEDEGRGGGGGKRRRRGRRRRWEVGMGERLTVLVRVLNEEAKLGDRELDEVGLVEHALGDGVDALVEERHGRGVVEEVGHRVNQLFGQTGLEGCECGELHVL